jgi:hypothetical protein
MQDNKSMRAAINKRKFDTMPNVIKAMLDRDYFIAFLYCVERWAQG